LASRPAIRSSVQIRVTLRGVDRSVILGFPYFLKRAKIARSQRRRKHRAIQGTAGSRTLSSHHLKTLWATLLRLEQAHRHPWKIISIGIKDSDREHFYDAARCPERRHAQHWYERSITLKRARRFRLRNRGFQTVAPLVCRPARRSAKTASSTAR